MVEARKNPYPEKIWLDGPTVLLDPQSVKGAQNYLRADIAERQIAELRADDEAKLDLLYEQEICQGHAEDATYWQTTAEAAEAENARLRALPLKDEVERDAQERARDWLRKRWCQDHPNEGHVKQLAEYEAFLSRLRAGEQEGWRTECATEGCDKKAFFWFERGGVGSHYCHDCYMRIQALSAAPKQGEAK